MIRNRNIDRYWRNLFIPAVDFSSVRTPTATPAIASAINTNEALSINSTGIFGVKMNTAGDTIRHYFRVPVDFDSSQPTYVRVHWTSGSSTTADTITWKVFRKARTQNVEALTATIDTALDTAIPQDTVPVATAFAVCVTSSGKINAGSITPTDVQELALEMDAKAAGLSEDIFALGVELLYVPLLAKDTYGVNTPALPSGW